MRVDIDRLASFYASPLGRMTQAAIIRRVTALWPAAEGLDVLGFGHVDGLLDRYRTGARRVISASPDAQGAVRWPGEGPSNAVLVDEQRLPFADNVFDRLIVAHGLEEADGLQRLLREFWRVMAPEGRILVIAAHRRGLWARAESTPFGHGQPFTKTQLYRLLGDSMFEPTAFSRALYAPPIDWPLITRAGEAWERVGRLGWGGFGGVILIEAVKRLYIDPRGGKPARARRVVAPAASAATVGRTRLTRR